MDCLYHPQKKYMMTNCIPNCIRGQKIRDLKEAKCELQNVRATKQSSEKCFKKCLVNIVEKKILFLRFDA